jgi:hypothetical protein
VEGSKGVGVWWSKDMSEVMANVIKHPRDIRRFSNHCCVVWYGNDQREPV